ncbi:MAG: T9SS type A sorting domain-containing protein, partial [Cyclobacteriaceae bacterium]|nr:T9SS type A sorting domain-containing protein [Cyclobacteriaceae bacterium]
YETMDYQPIEGVSYYRLKQTDFDGKISFSPIERVDFVGQNSIQVFPNPSDAIFHLANSAQLDIESIKVLNNLGQIVFPVIRKDENIMIDLSHLSSGIYILQVWNGTFLSNARLIKRN